MRNSEHDMTKLMLETIRTKSSQHKNLIKENEEISQEFETTDSESNLESLDDVERDYYEKDLEAFQNDVDTGAKITAYSIDKDTENVNMSGTLSNKLEWSYSKEAGVQIGTAVGNRFIDFNKEMLPTLNVLLNYYDNWVKSWQKNFNEDSLLKR